MEYPFLCCFPVLFLLAISILVIYQILKTLRCDEYDQKSTADIPPGSQGLPLVGETLQFMTAINSSEGFYDFVRVRRLWYGKCFKTNIFGETHVFVSSRGSAKVILNNDLGKFSKRYMRSIAQLVGHHSLLCASPQHHRLIRCRLANLFSTNTMSYFVKQFDELVVESLSRWNQERPVVVLSAALEITFKSMCKMLMSLESEKELDMLQTDVAEVCKAMLAFPLNLPWTRFYNGIQARKRIVKKLERIITDRRSGRDCHEDFLQHLIASPDDTTGLTDAEIQDNILTMIIAGQDTTASAITWMVKYLSENKKVMDAIKAEQLHLIERDSSETFLTLEDLNHMPYASKVVKESLRMASVVPWFPRLVMQDCEIEGYKIKRGWNVNIDARSIHLDPTIYNDSLNFNPSRFDDGSKPYSFLAFGMGGRTCLGMNMAKAMMMVFLYRLTTTYKWKVIDSDSSIEKWALFSRLKNGCPISVTKIIKD